MTPPDYRVNKKGEHVMTYHVFQGMTVHKIISTLNKMGERPSKRKIRKGAKKS